MNVRHAMWVICAVILIALVAPSGSQVRAGEPSTAPENAVCSSTVGPGIAPPANVPSGIPGFHASWYGQSGYMTL